MRGVETALFDLEMDRQEEDIEKDFSHIDEPTRTAVAFTLLAKSNTLSLYLRYETTFRRSFDCSLSNLLRLRALSVPAAAPTAAASGIAASPDPQPLPSPHRAPRKQPRRTTHPTLGPQPNQRFPVARTLKSKITKRPQNSTNYAGQ